MENSGVPSGQPGVSRYLCGVGVAGFGQLFDSRGQLLAPVVLGRGLPDVLLRFTDGRAGIDRYEFIVPAEQEVAAMKVTVKQDLRFEDNLWKQVSANPKWDADIASSNDAKKYSSRLIDALPVLTQFQGMQIRTSLPCTLSPIAVK